LFSQSNTFVCTFNQYSFDIATVFGIFESGVIIL